MMNQFPDRVCALNLPARRDLRRDEPLFSPRRNNRTGVLGKALDPSTVFYIVTRYARTAGVANRVSPHSCRATAISNARDHNVPDRAIQDYHQAIQLKLKDDIYSAIWRHLARHWHAA